MNRRLNRQGERGHKKRTGDKLLEGQRIYRKSKHTHGKRRPLDVRSWTSNCRFSLRHGGPSQQLLSSCWATVCKTVRSTLSDRRPVYLSVCNVGVLWPNSWMDQDETWDEGRPRPQPHYVWGPSSPHKKWGYNPHVPIFSPCLL